MTHEQKKRVDVLFNQAADCLEEIHRIAVLEAPGRADAYDMHDLPLLHKGTRLVADRTASISVGVINEVLRRVAEG